MIKRELLCPAGDMECLKAAVSAGCDAVYAGGESYNARQSAANFTDEELEYAVKYCKLRGVKFYLTLNTVLSDRELEKIKDYIKFLVRIGVDGVIIQSLGLARLIKRITADLPIHASTQLTVHSLEGVKEMAELGFERVVLSRELSLKDIEYICDNSPVEIEVFIHGALCMCWSGQCYFSSLIGQRSGNRGRCAQPCRQKYDTGYALSLKDLSSADIFENVLKTKIISFKIEGRLKSKEYVYTVCRIYRKLIDENRSATKEEIKILENVFSRQGFTDGYLKGNPSKEMFGVRCGEDKAKTAKFSCGNITEKKIPLEIYFNMDRKNFSVSFSAMGKTVNIVSDKVEEAEKRETEAEEVREKLIKTGDTDFFVKHIEGNCEKGLFFPISAVNSVRREGIARLEEKILMKKEPVFSDEKEVYDEVKGKSKKVCCFFRSYGTALSCLEFLEDEEIFVPVYDVKEANKRIKGVFLNRINKDSEREETVENLKKAKEKGIEKVMLFTCDMIKTVKDMEFEVICGFSFNAYNSGDISALKEMGAKSVEVSFECSLAKTRDMKKILPLRVFAYGYLPLMVTENCIIKNSGKCINYKGFMPLSDKEEKFNVICEKPHRNIILNSKPLIISDRTEEFERAGVSIFDFFFTVESREEIKKIMKMYKTGESPEKNFTRGLYFKNIM